MGYSDMINNNEEVETNLIMSKEERNEFEEVEKARICAILSKQFRRVDYGSGYIRLSYMQILYEPCCKS